MAFNIQDQGRLIKDIDFINEDTYIKDQLNVLLVQRYMMLWIQAIPSENYQKSFLIKYKRLSSFY